MATKNLARAGPQPIGFLPRMIRRSRIKPKIPRQVRQLRHLQKVAELADLTPTGIRAIVPAHILSTEFSRKSFFHQKLPTRFANFFSPDKEIDGE